MKENTDCLWIRINYYLSSFKGLEFDYSASLPGGHLPALSINSVGSCSRLIYRHYRHYFWGLCGENGKMMCYGVINVTVSLSSAGEVAQSSS